MAPQVPNARTLAAYRHCSGIMRASNSSFAAAFWMLSRDQRRALHAIYAFCRLADDIADDEAIRGDRRKLLGRWREELDDIYSGEAMHPVGIAMADAVARYDLPKKWFEDLLEGIEMDLSGAKINDFQQLERYCYCVASTVGLAIVAVLGMRGEAVERYAVDMGIAVQLTNILRDVGDDAMSGRVYLAQEDLNRHGITREAIESAQLTGPMRELLVEHAARAHLRFQQAQTALPPEYARALRPAQAMGAIYHELLRRLEASNFPCLERVVRLSKAERIGIAARIWLRPGLAA